MRTILRFVRSSIAQDPGAGMRLKRADRRRHLRGPDTARIGRIYRGKLPVSLAVHSRVSPAAGFVDTKADRDRGTGEWIRRNGGSAARSWPGARRVPRVSSRHSFVCERHPLVRLAKRQAEEYCQPQAVLDDSAFRTAWGWPRIRENQARARGRGRRATWKARRPKLRRRSVRSCAPAAPSPERRPRCPEPPCSRPIARPRHRPAARHSPCGLRSRRR